MNFNFIISAICFSKEKIFYLVTFIKGLEYIWWSWHF